MHIQWTEQIDSSADNGGRPCLVAVLVMASGLGSREAETRLGSVQLRYLDTRITCTRDFHHGLFWKKVEHRLDRLGLDPELRRTIEEEITARIPRPTSEWALWGVTCIPRFE